MVKEAPWGKVYGDNYVVKTTWGKWLRGKLLRTPEQERKVSYNSTFIEFVFDIPALSVDVICISWETCYWKVCFQFCGQIFLNKCGGYFFILKNPLLNIFFLFLLCLKKFFFLFFCVEKLTSQISWWKLRNKYSFMLFWN